MSKTDNLHDFLQDIGDAIKYKKGIADVSINAQDFSDHIKTIDVGGAVNGVPDENKDVRFYDYDGTLLYSYTLDEVRRLEKLPTLPGHVGLLGQGWNWDYEDVIALDRPMNIGANYITDDGKTRLYLNIRTWSEHTGTLVFNQDKANGVTVDWGDGSPTETFDKLYGYVNATHTYTEDGKYMITLLPDDDCNMFIGSTGPGVFNATGTVNSDKIFSQNLYKVELGKNIVNRLHVNMLWYCWCVETITIPNNITQIKLESTSAKCIVLPKNLDKEIGINAYCLAGKFDVVCIPNGVTSIPPGCFNSSWPINLTYPNSIKTIESSCANNYEIKKIVIPDDVKILPKNLFQNCFNLSEIKFPDGLRSLSEACLSGVSSLQYIEVPDGVVEIPRSAFYRAIYSNRSGTNYIKLSPNIEIIDYSGLAQNDIRFLVLPKRLKTLGYSAISDCTLLTNLVFPSTLETIGAYTFGNNTMVTNYDFTACNNIPTLSDVNAFTNIAADCEIRVPSDLYDDWISSDNWSNFTKYIKSYPRTEYDYEALMNKYYGNN